MNQRIRMEFRLFAGLRFDDEANVWVAECPALDVLSQGTTQAEAKTALRSALVQFIRTCWSRSILDDILNEHGFEMNESAAADSNDADIEFINIYPHTFEVDLPFSLLNKPASREAAACPS